LSPLAIPQQVNEFGRFSKTPSFGTCGAFLLGVSIGQEWNAKPERTIGFSLAVPIQAFPLLGTQLIKAHVDDIHFERGGAEVHMRKRSRITSDS
jgi:hypothetical protein